MKQPKLIAFAGSTRRHSFNRAVLDFAAGSARRSGAEADLVDLVKSYTAFAGKLAAES